MINQLLQGCHDRNMLLRRLERNQKDIAKCHIKLRSYLSEPRTYHQFVRLSELKATARELRETNNRLSTNLREGKTSVKELSPKFVENYIQKFQTFSKNVASYVEEVKVHDTACF